MGVNGRPGTKLAVRLETAFSMEGRGNDLAVRLETAFSIDRRRRLVELPEELHPFPLTLVSKPTASRLPIDPRLQTHCQPGPLGGPGRRGRPPVAAPGNYTQITFK